MTLKSYLRMLLAAVTLLFVTSGCNDDDNKVGPPPSYTFSVAVSDVTETEATVTVTPSNDQATYYYAAVKKADFDAFESDAAYAQNILATLQAAADRKVLSLKEYLETALSKGSAPQKVTDLTAGTDYYAVALGMLTDGRFTSDLVKEAFKTGETPEPAGLTFEFKVENITKTAADVDVIPSNDEDTYYFDVQMVKAFEGMTEEEMLAAIVEDYVDVEYLTSGPDGYPAELFEQYAPLKPGTEYYVYAVGYDADKGATTKLFTYKFTTQAPTGEAPDLDFAARAGDANNQNTSTKIYCSALSLAAVSAKYACLPKVAVDELIGKGASLEDIVDANGKNLPAEGLAYLTAEPGLGLTLGTFVPSTAYTAIFKVVSAGGMSTVKSADVTTTADGGETGDGPELTLTMKAGDNTGADPTTKITCLIKSSGVVSAKAGLWTKTTIDDAISKGMTIEDIINNEKNGEAIEDKYMAGINGAGLNFTWGGASPATAYTAIIKVTDAAGNSTVKSATGSTEAAGEASDAYKAWLGTWTLTSTSSEVNNAPVSFDVTFVQGVVNSSYKLQGWGITTLREQTQVLPSAKFDNATGNFEILEGQALYTDPDDNSVLTLTGRGLLQGEYYIINGGYPGFTGVLNADKNSATIIMYQGSVNGMGAYTTSSMEFFWFDPNGKDIYWQKAAEGYTDNDYPIGPYTMTKKSSGASVSVSKSASTLLHASKLSSVLSARVAVAASAKQDVTMFEKNQVTISSSLVFDRPVATYEATISNSATIEKPLGLKKHFIKK